VRLQRVLAAAGVASRRHCEDLIEQGQVTVNGQRVLALPAWVDPYHDRIEVAGRLLPKLKPRSAAARRAPAPGGHVGSAVASGSRAVAGTGPKAPAGGAEARPGTVSVSAGHIYVMLNKPRRVVSTAHDPEGRRTVTDMVQLEGAEGPVRLFPVGRLDADSTGLILLTNDGELANRLTHPRYGMTKDYQVSVKGLAGEDDLRRLREGLLLTQYAGGGVPRPEGYRPGDPVGGPVGVKRAAVERASIVHQERGGSGGARTILRLTLREGQNREVRRLLARLGFKVHRLRRVGIGGLGLKGLASGHWRFLKNNEVHALKSAVGL
jgi:pseudouridine synthase